MIEALGTVLAGLAAIVAMGVIIVCGIVLGPVIGWILYLILDDAKRAKQASAPQNTRGMHSEDPLEAWERQERAAAGPPPPPPSYKQQSPSA